MKKPKVLKASICHKCGEMRFIKEIVICDKCGFMDINAKGSIAGRSKPNKYIYFSKGGGDKYE